MYGQANDYQPPPDVKERFTLQLMSTNRAAKRLKSILAQSEQMLRGVDPSLINKESAIYHKIEHLKASVSIYKTVRRLLKNQDSAIENRYDEIEAGTEEHSQLTRTYQEMMEILNVFEVRLHSICDAPDSWFTTQVIRAKQWLEANQKNVCRALGVSCLGGATLGGYNYAYGHCLIYSWVLGSCNCASWGVASSILIGAGMGLLFGVLVVLMAGASTQAYDYISQSKESARTMKGINAMVKKMEDMPQDEINKLLAQVRDLLEKALPAGIPSCEDDRKCVICFKEGCDVQTPVKAPRCKGNHFMCKDCWLTCLTRHGDKCTVCRV
jgi:hypothetical protein